MADTMIVGQVVGVKALAAVGAGDWLVWLVLGIMTGITQGFFYSCISVLWSKGKGKSEMRSGEKLYHDSIIVCGRTRSK